MVGRPANHPVNQFIFKKFVSQQIFLKIGWSGIWLVNYDPIIFFF